MKTEHYVFYTDPGHGWLRVKISEVITSGIAGQISGCSYMNGKYAYLEEDCDKWRFLKAKFGENVSAQELDEKGIISRSYSDTRSPIREFEHFQLKPAIPEALQAIKP
jgi:hypothetical protein